MLRSLFLIFVGLFVNWVVFDCSDFLCLRGGCDDRVFCLGRDEVFCCEV